MSLSVLMSVYDGESAENLDRALKSLVNQTYQAEETIVVEDGPINDTLHKVIDKYRQLLNIKTLALETNSGLATALNAGLKLCENDLVARMDSDDISLPDRFMQQMEFMHSNHEVAVSSGWIEEIDSSGKVVSVRKLPLSHDELCKFAKYRSPISHAAAIYRKSTILAVDGYPAFRKAQDYALWSLMMTRGFRFANIDKPIYQVPIATDFYSRRGLKHLINEIAILKFQYKIGFIGQAIFLRNLIFRSIIRLVPDFVKSFLYKYARR